MPVKLTQKLADALVLDCNLYPYHDQVAHANGVSFSELEEFLQRGAAVGAPKLFAEFAKRYAAADSELAKETFKLIRDMCEPGGKGGGANIRPMWDWYNKRWPPSKTTSLGAILESEGTMQFSLVNMLTNPEPEVLKALTEAGWSRASE